MTDPLDALRMPVMPADPDPTFATRLRARVERALALPRGVAMTTTTPAPATDTAGAVTAAGAAIPYLAVSDARRAIDWYVDVLGARAAGDPIVMPDGRVGHAELELAGGRLFLSDEHPEIGVVGPQPGAASVTLVLTVPDVDATIAAAVRTGGQLTREPYEGYGHRNATVVDPWGHRWMLQTPLPAAAPSPRHGDIGYVSVWVPDADRAAAFYASVLGWTYAPQHRPQSRRVVGTAVSVGIFGGQERGTLFCCYAVDDAHAAVARVRAAGGRADEPTPEPYGLTAECTDDQGTAFAVYQPPADAPGERPPANGARAGDVAYVTLEVVDSTRARDFYGAVLGWRFSPGRVEDGWGVEGIVPMTGMSGGNGAANSIPMWRVDDIDAAVARVRRAGGTATDPQRQPYGITCDCTDDQGTRFYLGQL